MSQYLFHTQILDSSAQTVHIREQIHCCQLEEHLHDHSQICSVGTISHKGTTTTRAIIKLDTIHQ